MKYNVRFSCGHEESVQLYGKASDREKKIRYYEGQGLCRACYMEQKEVEKSVGCDEVEMLYRDYKNDYPSCQTKAGSYDGERKTVVVYVPKKV